MGKTLVIKGADFSNGGIVPEYTRLDYITPQSGKLMKMNLATALPTTARMVVKVEITELPTGSGAKYMIGCLSTNTTSTQYSLHLNSSADKLRGYFGSTDQVDYVSNPAVNTPYTIDVSPNLAKVNDVTVSTSVAGFDRATSLIIPIGYRNQSTYYAPSFLTWRLYSIAFYSSASATTPSVNLIPVRRTADNVECLLDTVSGQYVEFANE